MLKNILVANEKGGVGKSAVSRELVYALRRKGKTAFLQSLDPQDKEVGVPDDLARQGGEDYRVIDSPGFLLDDLERYLPNTDLIIIPILPSVSDIEPTSRTFRSIKGFDDDAKVVFVINQYRERGILDRKLVETCDKRGWKIATTIPRTVQIANAYAAGASVAEYDKRNKAIKSFDELAECVVSGVGR